MSVEVNNSNTVSDNEQVNSGTTSSYEQDMEKYTKIDNLDEDSGDVQYVLVSFVSPEKVMNCSIRGLKIRHYRNRPAIFSDYSQAQKAATELNEREKYFDIFVMSTGRWCAWDPAPDDRTKVESEKWANEDQQRLMDNLEKVNQKQQKDLNELNALVGKKKDMIEQSKDEHKDRIINSVKQGISEKSATTEVQSGEPQAKQPQPRQVSKTHDSSSVKERLRRTLEERRQKGETETNVNPPASVQQLTSEVKTNLSDQAKLEENINKAKSILEKIQKK